MGARLKSRKFWVAVMATLVIIVARMMGLELEDSTILSISGIVSAYLLGQSYVDSKKDNKEV